MAKSTRPSPNGFIAAMRKVYNPLGFSKGYNFILFFCFAIAFAIFSVYSMPSINVDSGFCGLDGNGSPEECTGIPRIGMFMHLAAILPASILACFQFLPIIRHKAIIIYRVNRYIILMLSIVGAIGALMVTRHAFSGGLEVQTSSGVLFMALLVR